MAHTDLRAPFTALFTNAQYGFIYGRVTTPTRKNPTGQTYLRVNQGLAELAGHKFAADQHASAMVSKIFAAHQEFSKACRGVVRSGKPSELETYIQELGTWFHMSIWPVSRRDFMASIQNISERKETEERLGNSKIAARNVLEDLTADKASLGEAWANIRAFLLSIGDGMITTDTEGRITMANSAAENILGKKSSELIGRKSTDVIQLEDAHGKPIQWRKRPTTLALNEGVKTIDAPSNPEYYYRRADKTVFPVAITLTPVRQGNKIIGTVEIFRDISKEKDIDRVKTEFVSLASHQLRTPLSTVKWYSEMLLSDDIGPVNAKQKKYLDVVYKSNERMIDLVNALLNVSRLELGSLLITPEPVDIVTMIRSVIGEQQKQAQEKKIRLIEKFADHFPPLNVDPKILRIVFQNLLSNAIKYTLPGGTVTISVTRDTEKNLLLTFADTGVGIPKKQHDMIFTKLFRADNVRTLDAEGTGLGLYIVKSIVVRFGGKIWFTSEENKGSTFYVTLPLSGMKRQEGTKGLV